MAQELSDRLPEDSGASATPRGEASCACAPAGDELRAVFHPQYHEEREKVRMRMSVLAGACLFVCAGAITLTAVMEHARYEPCEAYRVLDQIWRHVEYWKALHGHYPGSLRELVCTEASEDWEPCFDEYPRDPYGHDFVLQVIDQEPVIIFYGEDGVPGGTGPDRDWLWPRDRPVAKPINRCATKYVR